MRLGTQMKQLNIITSWRVDLLIETCTDWPLCTFENICSSIQYCGYCAFSSDATFFIVPCTIFTKYFNMFKSIKTLTLSI